jgi:hypothetical protein
VTTGWGCGTGLPGPRMAADDSAELGRLARYRAEHPQTRVAQGVGFWQAITPEDSGETTVTRYTLGELLDKLDPPDSG